jgi:hypothetical protein
MRWVSGETEAVVCVGVDVLRYYCEMIISEVLFIA